RPVGPANHFLTGNSSTRPPATMNQEASMEITHQDRLNRVRDIIIDTVRTADLERSDPTGLLVSRVHEEMNKMAVENDRLTNQRDMMVELVKKERTRVAELEDERCECDQEAHMTVPEHLAAAHCEHGVEL